MSTHLDAAGHVLSGNPYPGRGIIAGRSPGGRSAVSAYFIMGRSQNSRNRIFVPTADGIATEPFRPELLENPDLILYHPIRLLDSHLVVTNGDQTDTICDFLRNGQTFRAALQTRSYEPDAPNWTPRISACLALRAAPFSYEMSILRRQPDSVGQCERAFWQYTPAPGTGHLIHTYRCDGDPLPAFPGAPIPVSIPDTAQALCQMLWPQLDQNNRIALYVRYTNLQTGAFTDRFINRHHAETEA